MKHLLMNLGLVIMYVYGFADIYSVWGTKAVVATWTISFSTQTEKEKETKSGVAN